MFAYFLNGAPRRICLDAVAGPGVKETTNATHTEPAPMPRSVLAWPRNMGSGEPGPSAASSHDAPQLRAQRGADADLMRARPR